MKIYDSIHGFIHCNELEALLIDSLPFQRLRYIHQLGITHHVYPGGTHTRFEHSLGTMHLATLIYDQIAKDEDRDYWRQIVRLAALCHDIGHLPFSHVAEKRLLGDDGHEFWTLKIIESGYLQPIIQKMEKTFPGKPILDHLSKLSLGQQKLNDIRPEVAFSPLEGVYAQIIAGDFFGADRIDYLLRDAKMTGLSYGLFDYTHLIEMLQILPLENDSLSMGVEENGIESCEALLLARHFMHRRVYQYASARAYSFHLARFMEVFYRDPKHFSSVEGYLSMSEAQVLCALMEAKKNPQFLGHFDARCIFEREQRFQAIHIPNDIELPELETFKEEASIPHTHIHWDLGGKYAIKPQLKLPILRKNRKVVDASEFSEIGIPPSQKCWLYLAPEYEFSL